MHKIHNITRPLSYLGKQRRYNSTIPALVSYFKDKGVYIPFANKFLKPMEHDRYIIYRNIKLGNTEAVDKLTKSLSVDEKETLIGCVEDLKKQPYSIPNFMIGALISKFAFKLTIFGMNLLKIPHNGTLDKLIPDISQHTDVGVDVITNSLVNHSFIVDLLGMSAIAGSLYIGYQGALIVYDELRAPYYDYDRMIKMLKIDKNATINTESKIEENDDTKKINKNHKTDEEDYDDLENIR